MNGFCKQPFEEFIIAGDFAPVLEDGETLVLSGCEYAAQNAQNVEVFDVVEMGSLAIDGSLLKIRVRGGIAEQSPYMLSLRCLTSHGNKYEINIRMEVRRIG